MPFWLMAIVCGLSQVLQAMTNGSAARAGLGAVWVGAMSATVSMLTLLVLALVVYRLPLPDGGLLAEQGLKTVAGGIMGAIIVAGLAFVAPKLGPTQTFILYFFAIAVGSVLIDSFGLLGASAKPPNVRQLIGVAMAGMGLVLARL
jgi:bacterial/archaeal transporter family-2 protein